MLPLARLSAIDIERIVGAVPGGAANVQDIYPLLPLQEGILFHHLMASEGDMYLAPSLYSVGSRAQLDAYLRALQAVIDRHDMLRTSIHWEGLPQPVQVVWRQASVVVEEARFDAAGGDVAEQLKARFDPRRYRLDVRQAPLMRVCVAEDAPNRRWMALWLSHHLLGDPIALAVIREEIQAHLLGQVERLPAPLPFRNFVAQALLGAPREEHEAFFRQVLGDVDEPTAPFGLIDAHGDGSGIEAAWRQVAGPLVERLRGVGRGLGVSIASLYHLAWALVLARVSGRDDVVFGTVLFGRMQGSKGADQVVGLLMNTLPVRVRIGDERVEDGVRQIHKLLGELMRHEHAPLALAQRCSGVEPPTPLFSALLNYRYGIGSATTLNQAQSQERGRTAAAWEEIRFEESDELYKRTNYSLTLNVDDLREGFSLNVQAQSPIDPERVCAYVHTALEQLVEALEGAAETPLRSVDALPAPERRRMLVEWNATHSEYPRGKFIQELFEEQASSAPEAVAVAHQGRQLSYGELNARANRLAHHLRKLGVEPDARVALCVERSLDMVVGLLAVLKAGGAYVPLDPAYPVERLTYMLGDSAAVAALTHAQVGGEIRSTLAGTGVPVIDLEADAGLWESEPGANPDRASIGLSSEHLAYVIYTSGSTGKPKGAMIPHRGICNRLFWMQERYNLTGRDAVLQKTPFSFDVSVWEFFWPLISGARLVMAEPGGHQDRDYLIEEIERRQITTIHFVPSMLQVFLEGEGLDRLLGLSRVFSSGEALPHELEERFFKLLDAELHNLYGPTEASVDVTYWQCERGGDYQVTPIGRPIANTQIHLLDRRLRPVPPGVAGELHIGGAGLGRGYLARPELTAEKFAPNPFAEEAGARLYKSGDLARYRADENIEFLGRIDHQVKIRGLRIELGEIEEALRRHRSVREAVVVVREDQPGEKRLVAYLTASSGEAVEAGELRGYLKGRLPEYMVPAAFAQLERMPLTANGKIDRKALPEPGQDWHGGEYEAPVGEVETALAEIWAEALRVERVGRHDDFFDLGGHSLLGVKVVSRLRQAFGVEVSTTELFLRPTLAEFAETVKSMAGSASPPITVMARDQSTALSYAQQRLWFLAQMEGVSRAYHIGLGLRVSGALDREALRRALDRTVARHEALRTTFTQVDGKPSQLIAAEDVGFALQEHDLRHHADAAEELERLMTEEAMAPFDLEAGPLARGRLVQLSSSEHALLVTMHHIVSDGWSMGVLTREVIALYRAFSEGQADPLPPLTIQYADYAAWQRRWITGEVLQAQAEYWRNTLAGAPALLELPTDRPRPAQQDHAGAEIGLILDEGLTADLKALSRRNGATLFMTLLAGWATLLSRLAGQDEVVVGTPVANRARAEVEPLIGFFVNTLALRLDLSNGPTVSELLQRVKAQALAAQKHQDLPFEQVVDILKPPRSLAQSPLFQVMFAWQNNEAVELEAPGLTMSALPAPQVTSKFDLALSLSEAAAGIAGKLEYATALFDGATIERYCGYLRNILRAMAADDQQAVGRLQILSQSQRQQLLTEWNATETPYPHDQCIHELFEARAARHPDANAVVQEGRHLTYAGLNAEANRLARHLRGLGAQPEARVAILLDRSLELVVVELAILKCGAVYVPLDRNAPTRRLTFMIEDCQAGLVLTVKEMELPLGAGVKRVDIDEQRLDEQSADNVGIRPDSEAAAYIMYTSGSTGTPKGVVVPHRAIGRLVINNGYANFEADDRVALAANPAFDATTMEMWAPLLHGGCVVVIPQAVLLESNALARLLVQEQVSVLHLVAGLLGAYAEPLAGVFQRLRYLLTGGDLVDPRAVARVLRHSPPQSLIHCYGPSESTTFATTDEVREVAEGGKSLPIGRPIGNTKVYVLDRQAEPAPVGVAGEIYVGGMGVAHGYLNRPGQTAERFVADPFAGEANARMYRTGDVGRYLADGAIEYLGRNDFQVKIRGFRVELGEVEARLEEQPGIRKAVVVAHENGAGDKYLVAYYTTEPEKSSETAEAMAGALRENLSAVLPEYMAPAAYVKMEAMPLTSNGKLDRRALPAPDGTAYGAGGYEAPVGEIETMLAEIWADLLDLERISRHDNFFALGGYSLLVTKLIARIQKELGVEIKVQELFSKPTLFLLAKHLTDTLLAELTAEDLEAFAKQS
jgi:amino acid adenylation domain-containing protein